tara:strand:- start:36 stop:242 length:207 start_codon:yes stop_codon:yes gene_type:complete
LDDEGGIDHWYQEKIKNPPAYLKPRDQIAKVELKGTLNLPGWEVKDIQVVDCRRPVTFVNWVNVGLVK